MPVNSRDVQFGAAIGFIVIVGIVTIYFGFSTKLVLALLAGLGILFCASLVDGYVRAAMLGTAALLLLLIAYDLATSCDSACQQSRAQAAQQRAAQEQTRLAALQQPANPDCTSRRMEYHIGAEEVDVNPLNATCVVGIVIVESSGCINVRRLGEAKEVDTKFCKGNTNVSLPNDVKYIRSADGPLTALVALQPPPK
jgi:hypothetical protein